METHIYPAYHLWSGWVQVFFEGRLIFSFFENGIFDVYISHLLTSEECRMEVGVSEEEVRELKEKIDEEWKMVAEDC